MPIPCPHFKITIVKRSQGQSAVAGAAYQSGERLFSEYDQKTKFYNKKKELVHAEIMLPSHAPPGYADRATLWNAVEAVENQWNSQLARRIVLAFPVEVPKEQYLSMVKGFCQEQFVSKGMITDFAFHDKGDGNPHAHILLTIRAMDEHGKWLPKARKVYDLDENGERIRLPSGNWKCHKENTVDWNDQKYAEIWRHSWETITNRYLEAAGRPERVDLRSFERQGIQQIPTVHLGPAAHQMEKRGVETFLGNLNRDIRAANSLMQSIRSAIRGLQRWIAELNEKKQLLIKTIETILKNSVVSSTESTEDYHGEKGLLYCGKCHTPKEAFFAKGIVLMGKNKHPVECVCQKAEREQQESIIRQQKHNNLVRRLKADGFSDASMLNWRFENDNGCSPQMHHAHRYVEQWQTMHSENLGLLLWGGVGTGKSFLAGCIANALMEQEVPVCMTNFARILNELNNTFAGRNEVVDELCRYPLLIIDDFGMERSTEYALEQIYNIIDSRYRSQKPLIITTNLTLDEIRHPQDTAHARIYDRLLEMCVPLSCIGVSFRKETAQEKLERLKLMIG